MEEAGVQKRKRGRPRKNEAPVPARRGPGRPPKKQKSEVITVEDSGSEWGDGGEESPRRKSPVHTGLGILPNRAQNVLDVPEGGEEQGSGGMEFGPAGDSSLRAEFNVPRGRGRPRRTSHNTPRVQRQEQEEDAEETGGAPSGVPRADRGGSPIFETTARRRRGRPRKVAGDEAGGRHRPRTRNSTRVQRQDMAAEAVDADDYETSLTLIHLPIEVLAYSLSFLADRRSIRNAITSCSALYVAFKNRPSYIASCVLFNSMSDGVFEEACAVNDLKNESWKGANAGIMAIHRAYSKSRIIRSRDLTLENVKEMWKLHKAVAYFGRQIPRTLINDHPVTKQENYFYFTRAVRCRFQRALYRFSAYLDIMEKLRASPLHDHGGRSRRRTGAEFVDLQDLDDRRVLLAWHNHHSTVEIEQVSGICHLLINQFAPTFNDFLEHDIELGSRLHKYIVHPELDSYMSPIALKLPFLHKFMTATTRTLQREVIYPVVEHIGWETSSICLVRLPCTDEALNVKVSETDAQPGMWAKEPALEGIIRTPFFEDPDKGPVSAWSSLSRFNQYFIDENLWDFEVRYGPSRPTCRLQWGYVFWDLNMLENAGFKNINVQDRIDGFLGVTFPENHFERDNYWPLERYESNQATELLFMSHHEKKLMRERGETGCFNFEAFCESVKDHLYSNMPGIPEGIIAGFVDYERPERGLDGLMDYTATILANMI